MRTFAKTDILGLSISERIQLVADIWDTIAEIPEKVELSDEQKQELDNRLRAYHQNPDAGSPWEVVRERIGSRKCSPCIYSPLPV